MTNSQFVCHAHAAVNLHGFLSDKTPSLTNFDLGRRGSLFPLDLVFAKLQRGHIGHGNGLFMLHEHIDHAVLEHLEFANRCAELFALTGILHGHLVGHTHHAASLGTQSGNRLIGNLLDQWQAIVRLADQMLCRNTHIFKIDFRSAASIDSWIISRGNAFGVLLDNKDRNTASIALAARGTCSDNQMSCPRRPDHHRLMAIEHISAAICFGGRLEISKIVTATRLGISKGKNLLTAHNARKMVFFLGGAAGTAQEPAAADHAGNKRFGDEAFAKLFHDHHGINRAAAKPAIFFTEWSHKQTKLGELRPH